MTAATLATVCVHCGGREADPQTGRCLKCGKTIVSPRIADEFGHPTLDRGVGVSRHSPSAAYRQRPSEDESAEPPRLQVVNAEAAAEDTGPDMTGREVQDAATPEPPATVSTETIKRSAAAENLPQLVVFALPDNPATTRWIAETRALRDKLLAQAEKAETQIRELQAEAAQHRTSAEAFTRLLDQISIGTSPPVAAPTAEEPSKPAAVWARTKNGDVFASCRDCGQSDLPHCANGRCRSCDGRWRQSAR